MVSDNCTLMAIEIRAELLHSPDSSKSLQLNNSIISFMFLHGPTCIRDWSQ